MTAQQEVEEILGNGDRSAGRAIINFVNEALASNREEIARLAEEHNERVATFDSRVADFASASDVNDINQRLAAAAAALGGAVTAAHNRAVEHATPTNVEAAQVASTEAGAVGTDIDTRIERLETRVSDLEERADDHEERIVRLENRAEPIVIATPDPVVNEVPVVTDEPTRTQQIARDANPANWQGWMPWALAIIGLIFGWIVGGMLEELSQPALWDWVAWLFKPAVGAIGFFGGGLLGSRVTQRQPAAVRPAEA